MPETQQEASIVALQEATSGALIILSPEQYTSHMYSVLNGHNFKQIEPKEAAAAARKWADTLDPQPKKGH